MVGAQGVDRYQNKRGARKLADGLRTMATGEQTAGQHGCETARHTTEGLVAQQLENSRKFRNLDCMADRWPLS